MNTPVGRETILAFRLKRHHLVEPLPAGRLVEAAEPGIQTTQPGTVPMSLGLRVKEFTPAALETALRGERTLVEATAIRSAGHVIPARDFAMFTRGAYPTTEKGLERLLGPAWVDLRKKKIGASAAMAQVARAAMKALDRKALTQDEIHEEWRKRLPKDLLRWCRGCDSFHVSYPLVGALGMQGSYCYGPLKNGSSAFVRADQWLSGGAIDDDVESLRSQLVRRFLRYYGPGTSKGFATWAGLAPAEAKDAFDCLEEELAEVDGPKAPLRVLRRDLPELRAAEAPRGVLLLPPKDPILNLPDRETLVEDKKMQPRIWRMVGNPGVMLLDGEVAALWGMKKAGDRLQYRFEKLGKIPASARAEAEELAHRLAAYRECGRVEVAWGK